MSTKVETEVQVSFPAACSRIRVMVVGIKMDDLEITLNISPLDRPPEEYFGYNYDYGRVNLFNAIHYLTHRYGQSTEIHAIEILKRLSPCLTRTRPTESPI